MSSAIPGGSAWSWSGTAFLPTTIGGALLDRMKARQLAPDEEAEAEIIWGQPTQFAALQPGTEPTVTINLPDEEEPDEEEPDLQWQEVWREEEEVRVENPEDSEQYVIVANVVRIRFLGPDNRYHMFNLNPPEGPVP